MSGNIIGTMMGGLSNHLWQSTVFAVAAGLLTITFRKNRAHVRYWLWLSASLKFLVPFSLLMSMGSYLQWAPAAKKMATQAVSYTMVQITQPFPDTLSFAPSAPRTTDWHQIAIPIAILGIWLCGFATIVLMRLKGWLRIRAAVRAASPLSLGIPAGSPLECHSEERSDEESLFLSSLTRGEILRSAQNDSQRLFLPPRVRVRSAPGLLEPGVVGFLRPILLLPEGILKSLTPPQLAAVLAHELCHVRRRDNLTAALHMIVEAVFWFHPLVWWIGARLVEERERACDEEVLRLGSEAQVYAEGILNVCKFYAESPLTCVSGVTGSDIKKRMERIMKNQIGEALNSWKKFILATVCMAVLAIPFVVGMVNASPIRPQSSQNPTRPADTPKWEVVSIKPCAPADLLPGARGGGPPSFSPDGMTLNCQAVSGLIRDAYLVNANGQSSDATVFMRTPMEGGPDWINAERYMIEAKTEAPQGRFMMDGPMLQALLEDRFKLKVHWVTREVPLYALTVGKGGPKLKPHVEGSCISSPPLTFPPVPRPQLPQGEHYCSMGGGLAGPTAVNIVINAEGVTIDEFCKMFLTGGGGDPDRRVIDKSGLTGKFDIHLEYAPNDAVRQRMAEIGATLGEPTAPEIFTAVQEQLGLKLEPTKGPGDFLVIDHIERPSDNSAESVDDTPKSEAAAVKQGSQPGSVLPQTASVPATSKVQTQTPAAERPKFEVASVKPCEPGSSSGARVGGGSSPDRIRLVCQTLKRLIWSAYVNFANGHFNPTASPTPIEGGPAWTNSESFMIEAKAENPQIQSMMYGPMLQALLEDRFKLRLHRETREIPVYALTVAKGGPKLKPHVEGSCIPMGNPDDLPPLPPLAAGQPLPLYCGMARGGLGGSDANGVTLGAYGATLSRFLDRDVIDKTGISGMFDIHLDPDADPDLKSEGFMVSARRIDAATMETSIDPAIAASNFFRVQFELGKLELKLDPTKGPGDFLVIDSVERPTPN